MFNEPVKGKITDFEQFLNLLKFLGDDVLFKLKCDDESIVFCSKQGKFILISEGQPLSEMEFKKKLTNWILSGNRNISFTIIPALEDCPEGTLIDKDKIIEIIEAAKYLRQIPEVLNIKILNPDNVPEKLKAFANQKIPKNLLVNSSSISLIDLCLLEQNGAITIEKPGISSKISPLIGAIAVLIIIISGLFSLLPYERKMVTLTIMENLTNTLTAKRIINRKIPEKLNVKDAYLNYIYYKNGKLISPGMDRKPGTKDDIIYNLPEPDSPLFAMP
ncbi:hypothetical protein [Desulfurobacterium atlanticum]|uniref:DUF4388 domain-containing protein n=1 Tax=Desulfurobacterium atlanticum TaxID=240169 RepID=A0A238ZEG6_9BACT|nr:hypothetical protein [Desulfurobacterium atlanticum]SNR81905.1 hypothetical protein SAMN06265340_10836 [Desulfurobacterium atlanticum]